MKKLLAILLGLMTLLGAYAYAEDVDLEAPLVEEPLVTEEGIVDEDMYKLSGVIVELLEGQDIMINTFEQGDVIVHVSDKTVLEGVEALQVGQFIYIDFNGVMAMSLPGQITADKITCHTLTGIVLGVAGNNVHFQTEDGEYCLVMDKDSDVMFNVGEQISASVLFTEDTFAGLDVVTTEFVETVAVDKARE